MEQSKADPSMFRKVAHGEMVRILAIRVDDIIPGGSSQACDYLHAALNAKFPTNNLEEVKWYTGYAFELSMELRTLIFLTLLSSTAPSSVLVSQSSPILLHLTSPN